MSKEQKLSRAEIVRQRRAAQQAKDAQKESASRSMPPVTTRAGSSSVAKKKKRKPNVRQRRYEIAVNTASENLRTVSMPFIRLEWRAASALLVILLGIGLYLLWTSPYFMVAAPQIQGNQRLGSEEISSVLNLTGESVFLLRPNQLERGLLIAYPSLASVSITVSLPNQVRIHVTERQPLIVWQQQSGGAAWIDAEGIAFLPRGQVDGLVSILALGPPPAPVVDTASASELAPPPFISPETVAALEALAPYAPQGAPIIYDPQYGLGWNDARGWSVRLGDITKDIALKLRIYETMVNWFAQHNIHPVLVSVAHPHAPFYRTEQ